MEIGKLFSSSRDRLVRRLKDFAYRHAWIESHIKNGIAFQIRAMRKAAGWDQKKLAEVALGKSELQSMISRYENPDYGKYSMRTLLDLARAFDVGLVVRFEPFSELIKWEENLIHTDLAVPSFAKELETGEVAHPKQFGAFRSVSIPVSFYRPVQAVRASVVTDNLVYPSAFANFLVNPTNPRHGVSNVIQ